MNHQLHWLDITEYTFLGLTVIGIFIGIALNSWTYPLIALTITLTLNTFNRLRFQYRQRKRLATAIKQIQTQINEELETLNQKNIVPLSPPVSPVSEPGVISIIQNNLTNLEQSLNNIIDYLNHQGLPDRVERLEIAYNQLKQVLVGFSSPPSDEEDLWAIAGTPVTPLSLPTNALNSSPISIPEAPKWKEIYTLKEHSEAVSSLSISEDQKLIASGSWDESIKIWGLNSGKLLTTIQGHSQGVLSVVFTGNHCDDYTLASGSFDQTVKLWSLTPQKSPSWTFKLDHTHTNHTGSVHALACCSEADLLISGSYDQTLKQWHLKTQGMVASSRDPLGAIYAITLSADHQWFAGAGGDGKITLWQLETGTRLGCLGGNISSITCLAISSDGQTLAAGCVDGTVKIWHLEGSIFDAGKQPQPIRILAAHRGQVHALVFSPREEWLFTSGSDGLIKMWHPGSQKAIADINFTEPSLDHANAVFCLALSAEGHLLAAGGVDGTVRIWQKVN